MTWPDLYSVTEYFGRRVRKPVLVDNNFALHQHKLKILRVLNAESVDGIVVVQLPETLDSRNSRAFERETALLLRENSRFIFDLTRLSGLNSEGLGAIITCLKHVRSANGDLKLCAMSKEIRTFFELVRMHHVVDIFNTKQEAIISYK